MNATMTSLALATVLGGVFAAGVLCLISLVPRWAAPGLERRIAPYIRDITDPIGAGPVVASGSRQFVRDLLTAGGDRVARLVGGSEQLTRRLAQAGVPGGAARFRARQLGWAVVGLLVGAALTVVLALAGRATPLLALVPLIGAVGGALACDLTLQVRARRRLTRLQEELPAVLEFLSLCLAAGEGMSDSLRRVAAIGAGELAGELRVAVLEAGTGSTLADALIRMAARLELAPLTRGIDQLVASMERGAPLARVLQAQADDAREDAKRLLIEHAGRSEILMLVPLVFLVLPLSVVFALYPGVFMLQLGLG